MATRVVWSPEALEDIESIAQYIARDSGFYAKAVVSKLVSTAQAIPEAPLIGRIVPEIADASIRERLVYSYRMIYQLRENDILVVAVIHGKRLIEPVESRFE